MKEEVIAKLVGQIEVRADHSPLIRLHQYMQQVKQQMVALGKEADTLSAKLSQKLGIKSRSDNQAKIAKDMRQALDAELKTEQQFMKAKAQTMRADLMGRKLSLATTREQSFITTAALKDQQAMAVLAAKQHKAEVERLRVQGTAAKNEITLATAKVNQQAAAERYRQAQEKTVLLQQQQLKNASALQKAQMGIEQMKERASRAATRHAEIAAAAQQRASRLQEKHVQQNERFVAFQQRHAAWEARQSEPQKGSDMSLVGIAAGFGAVGASIWAATAAIQKVADHLGQVQTRVSDNQQFANILTQAGGKNVDNQKFAKSEFLRISKAYGTAVDNASAKDYRTFLMATMARGKSISEATQLFETQQSAFRGAGMSREEQRRTSLQLQQVRSKSQGDREDLNTFSEAAPLLVEPIRRAWALRNKYKGGNLERDFRASTTEGNLKAIDFENGIKLFVQENKSAIENQSQSLDANTTRLANTKFIQQQGVDSNPELIASINRRIAAENELVESIKPLKEASAEVNIALMNLAAKFFKFTLGKDESPIQSGSKIEALSPDKPAIDPSALTGATVVSTSKPVDDPVDKIFRKLFNLPDYRQGPASKIEVKAPDPLGLDPVEMNTTNLDKSRLPKSLVDMMQSPTMKGIAQAGIDSANKNPNAHGVIQASDIQRLLGSSVVNTTTITNAAPIVNNMTVTVNANTNADPHEIADAVRSELTTRLRQFSAQQKEVE